MSSSYFLLIDTSTDVCSVALATDREVLIQKIERVGNKHSALIGNFVADVLTYLPEGESLTAVGVAEGPGSYTGLRISAAFAKAFCMIRQIPLIAVPTPEAMVYACLGQRRVGDSDDVLFMPMIDARRMEVYTGVYDAAGHSLLEIRPLILDKDNLEFYQQKFVEKDVLFFGDGAAKAQEVMIEAFPRAKYIDAIVPEAQFLQKPVVARLLERQTCDIAYWTPFYLKEYEAKISTNKVLGDHRTK